MKCLSVLFEDESIQGFLQENEGAVASAATMFANFPQEVKNHITANLESFLDEDIKKTYANMVEFTENAAFNYLHELSSLIAEGQFEAPEAEETPAE